MTIFSAKELRRPRPLTSYDVRKGDCLEALPKLRANSIDSCVTDGPYGLKFMGKDWDYGVPGAPFWEAVLGVLKPGAHLVTFGGTRTHHRLMVAIEDAGFEIRDCLMWLYGQGFPKSHNLSGQWDGWGTALKPAWEPIVLARKPFPGTVAGNVLEHGTGGINVDGCRAETAGRWPANVLLGCACEGPTHDPGCAVAMLDEQSQGKMHGAGVARAGSSDPRASQHKPTSYSPRMNTGGMHRFGDTGGASRFFYTAKASRKEREAGLNAPKGERANKHPTVKPIALMRWLVRLVTPPGGLVLDPFMGSGSTGCAAVQEGFQFLGFEKNADYTAIAEKRIAHWSRQPVQLSL